MRKQPKTQFVYNPLPDDFSVTYDLYGDAKPIKYSIKAGEIKEFPTLIAGHIKKHLADEIINQRGIKTNHEDDWKAIMKEISVVV